MIRSKLIQVYRVLHGLRLLKSECKMPGVSIRISAISKHYGALPVIQDVSFEVAPGEFVALLGPSGSGKSTILMSVAGFVHPDSGTIAIDGKDVTKLLPRQRNIGMVFQKYALFPHMTVAQNVAFPLIQRGVARAEIGRRIGAVTELVGLRGFEDRPVPNLSGGQQQRVALARALVFQPPVLLMDEPLGALDKKMRERLQVEIKDIQRVTGTTVLFVTHDQTEALSMADRLLVLNHGRIEQVGTPTELYEAPRNAFVADFIGEANIMRGTVVDTGPHRCKVRIGGPDGDVAEGTPVNGAPLVPGAEVEVVLRPTKVLLDDRSGTPGLSGRVVSTAYFGDSVSIRIRLAGGSVITARQAAKGLWAPGDALDVRWGSQDARVFAKQHVKAGG